MANLDGDSWRFTHAAKVLSRNLTMAGDTAVAKVTYEDNVVVAFIMEDDGSLKIYTNEAIEVDEKTHTMRIQHKQ